MSATNGERDYRAELASMRSELVARVAHFFRWRGAVLKTDQPRFSKLIRRDVQRVRALDAALADAWKWRSAVESASKAARGRR